MEKKEMLKSVRSYLSRFGSANEEILDAIDKVDRKNFIPADYAGQAYIDAAIPIGKGQTASQPSTVARMLSLLKLKKGSSVLEIGSGSGWNACLLGFLVGNGKVLSLEIHKELADNARKNVKKSGIRNVEIEEKDFRKLNRKFDKIIFTAGISRDEEKMIKDFAESHLLENGILVCPLRTGPLIVARKTRTGVKTEHTRDEYAFVPLL
jgi:protein-L-isoaspartate(D-aspartate) O-methyltransferase